MDKSEILQTVNSIFIEVLDNEDIVLTNSTVADDVAGWDSLVHIQLVVAIEKKFRIRFKSQEIQNWDNVGQMIDSIEARLH